MELRLDGEVAVVTGAGRGIGKGVALGLAEAGAAVGVLDVDPATATATAREIAAGGGRATDCAVDVASEDELTRAVDSVRATFGPVSVLVAAAAIDEPAAVEQMTMEQWHRVLDVNLTGVFLSVRAVLEDMRRNRRGRIILFGSNLAEKGGEQLANYCAAKGGVHALGRALARELAPVGITVNVVAPGPVETDMLRTLPQAWLDAKLAELPLGRFGAVADIVPTVVLLASEAGAFYTGATMNVSGGDVIP